MNWPLIFEFSGLAVVEVARAQRTARAHLLTGGDQRTHKPRMYLPADCIQNHVAVAGADRGIFGLSIIPVPGGAYLLEVNLEGATSVGLGPAGSIEEVPPTLSTGLLRKQTPADRDDWGSLAYCMDLAELFPGTQLRPPVGSISFDLPSGTLRGVAPPLPRQEHEKWKVAPLQGPEWVQSFASRVGLATEQEGNVAQVSVVKEGVELRVLLEPIPGRRHSPVVVGIASECCMAPIPREASFTLRDFAPTIFPAPVDFPSIQGVSNVVCGNRPHCNGLVWLS